jgi:hypothetical protein
MPLREGSPSFILLSALRRNFLRYPRRTLLQFQFETGNYRKDPPLRHRTLGVRATARLLDVDKNTVRGVIRRAGQSSMAVMDKECMSLTPTQIQFDELWSFAQKKNGEETPEGVDLEDLLNSFTATKPQFGRHWLWTALDVDSRFIIFSRVSDGTLDDA